MPYDPHRKLSLEGTTSCQADSPCPSIREGVEEFKVKRKMLKNLLRAERRMVDPRYR